MGVHIVLKQEGETFEDSDFSLVVFTKSNAEFTDEEKLEHEKQCNPHQFEVKAKEPINGN